MELYTREQREEHMDFGRLREIAKLATQGSMYLLYILPVLMLLPQICPAASGAESANTPPKGL
jgi:hypothetical protein